MTAGDLDGRHPSVRAVYQWFSYGHLPEGQPREVSRACAELAGEMIGALPDSPELAAGLRKLLEGKDCLVRAAIGGAVSEDA